jgi:endogenous inhibitor of DNA gyrase (YacG/DUF329 family)
MKRVDTVSVPCPECGEASVEPVHRVATNDVIPCSLCGGLIDLSAADCQVAVAEAKSRMAKAKKA